jgi:hypothetical protein
LVLHAAFSQFVATGPSGFSDSANPLDRPPEHPPPALFAPAFLLLNGGFGAASLGGVMAAGLLIVSRQRKVNPHPQDG